MFKEDPVYEQHEQEYEVWPANTNHAAAKAGMVSVCLSVLASCMYVECLLEAVAVFG